MAGVPTIDCYNRSLTKFAEIDEEKNDKMLRQRMRQSASHTFHRRRLPRTATQTNSMGDYSQYHVHALHTSPCDDQGLTTQLSSAAHKLVNNMLLIWL